jgi:hypothetical protein
MAKAESQAATPPIIRIKVSPEWSTLAVSPLLYGMFVPIVLLDICLEIYHRLAFPILGIPTVPRGNYIKMDRHLLPYLPVILKIACAYCGYANGVFNFAMRIASDTEAYFCPIKHQASPDFHAPPHHKNFAEYGDAETFRHRWEK